MCLSAGLYLYFSRDASRQQSSVKRPVLSNPALPPSNPSRRTPGELKQRALQRTPAAPATNSMAPFISTLGPGATTYLGGMAALRALPPILSTNQVATLRTVIATPYSRTFPLSPLEFNGVKNVAADILLRQPGFPADLLADLALQSSDPAQDEVWRDYCLQMLTTGYLNLSGRGRSLRQLPDADSDLDAPAARELALDVLMSAASAGGGTWPGTALLGLNTILASNPAAFPRAELDTRILAVLADPSASEAAQITAVRLAGTAGMLAARSDLERLAASPSGLVRAVAVKSLSELDKAATSEASAVSGRATQSAQANAVL